MPRRTPERRFARELGVTPKVYARIVRLQSALAEFETGKRASAAAHDSPRHP